MAGWLGLVLVLTVAACATGATADNLRATAPRSAAPATSRPTVDPAAATELLAVLPDRVFGHVLTKRIVTNGATGAAAWLRDLVVELGRPPSDLTVALASDPEFPDLRVLAVRVRAVTADRLVAAYMSVATRFAGDLGAQDREFGGRHAVCFGLSAASPMHSCIGARDDVLYIVTSSEYVHITEGIRAVL